MKAAGFSDYAAFIKAIYSAIQKHAQEQGWLPVYWNIGDEPLGDDLARSAVNAEAYRRVIDKRVGRPVVLMDNYNATEGGIFAVTDRIGRDGLLMLPDRGVFFEFVPAADHAKPNARRCALWEVEEDVEYSIAVTTASGLFGYYIGDLVRFQSVFPHRMEFVGRTSGVLSLTQELTSFVEIERAIGMQDEVGLLAFLAKAGLKIAVFVVVILACPYQ
jgi:hypothetical protein